MSKTCQKSQMHMHKKRETLRLRAAALTRIKLYYVTLKYTEIVSGKFCVD